jgi:HEAT repeat protein
MSESLRMTDAGYERMIRDLNGRTLAIAMSAAKELSLVRDIPTRLQMPLIRTLENGGRALNRFAAAYVLQFVTSKKTISALERRVRDKRENASVRGAAAESLAHVHRRNSHNVLLSGLKDRSREVRFWCAFALGEMAEARAIPILERLAKTDRREVKGFHSVAQEAKDALANIRVETNRRRTSRCLFCVKA